MSDVITDNHKIVLTRNHKKKKKQESRWSRLTFPLFILTEIYLIFNFSYSILLEFGRGSKYHSECPREKSQG